MGNQSNSKVLRGQMRQLVKELMPEILQDSLLKEIELRLRAEINARLNLIDQRQKDIQGYVVRQSAIPAAAATTPPDETL
jgi:hypothetical protein